MFTPKIIIRKWITIALLVFITGLFYIILFFTRSMNVKATEGFASANNTEEVIEDLDSITEIIENLDSVTEVAEMIEPIPEEKDPLFVNMMAQIERQKQVDEMLIQELSSSVYSFEKPLVVIDPYGMSPLSALVLFVTSEPELISVHITGKTTLADVDFTFDGYNTNHIIPIYGLYPNEMNVVTLNAEERNGTMKSVSLEIQTEPLPVELSRNIILTDLVQSDNYQSGFNYTFVQKSAFDVNGDYRWFYNYFVTSEASQYDYKGNMILSFGAHEGDVLLLEVNHLGKIHAVYYSPYGVHHNIITMDGKNLLVNGSHGETVEDFLYQIDIESGRIVSTLDLKTILQRTRVFNSPDYTTTDWFHHNATVYDNGSIIVSGRQQSTIAKLTWPEGKIEWILSDHNGWNPMFEKYLLTSIGKTFNWCYGQHAPEILPDIDNDPNTIDILLFDNGYSRYESDKELQRAILNNEMIAPSPYSRMVHYRINEKNMTVEQIWEFGKEFGEIYYSYWCGNANMLENGNRLGTFDRKLIEYGGDINTNIIEIDLLGSVIWEAYITSNNYQGNYNAYRCERRPLYTDAANDLQIGVPARVFIPEDKLP